MPEHAALVANIIRGAELCLHCVARKSSVSPEQANGLLLIVGRTLRLRIRPHRCDACLESKTTFSVPIDGPAG
jgi:hypothetical protein